MAGRLILDPVIVVALIPISSFSDITRRGANSKPDGDVLCIIECEKVARNCSSWVK